MKKLRVIGLGVVFVFICFMPKLNILPNNLISYLTLGIYFVLLNKVFKETIEKAVEKNK